MPHVTLTRLMHNTRHVHVTSWNAYVFSTFANGDTAHQMHDRSKVIQA